MRLLGSRGSPDSMIPAVESEQGLRISTGQVAS